MENKHIDKIAALRVPDRREGISHPKGVGAEPPPLGSDFLDDALVSTGMEGSMSVDGGVVDTPTLAHSSFIEKNRIFEEEWKWIPVSTPEEYFNVLFSRPDERGREVNFMQATGQDYWGDHHYNAVAYNLVPVKVTDKKTGESVWKDRAKKIDITRDRSFI